MGFPPDSDNMIILFLQQRNLAWKTGLLFILRVRKQPIEDISYSENFNIHINLESKHMTLDVCHSLSDRQYFFLPCISQQYHEHFMMDSQLHKINNTIKMQTD